MNFSQIIESCLGTPRQTLGHAQTLSVLVQSIILAPAPLYRIAQWAAPISAEALGLSPKEKKSLNDDRVARSLDALVTTRARNLFFRIALRIIKEFELDTRRIHHDTTSITFHGQYASSVQQPRITRGFNKDHRPDLKQLVFGLNVTADGAVPVSHDVFSGNKTDDTVHCSNVNQLRTLLGYDEFIYVADSKLCTRPNLKHIASYGGLFVTLLPRTRAEDKRFREQLRQGARVRWRQLLLVPNKRRQKGPPDIYATTADGPKETSEGYRIVWCRSSQKAEFDVQARDIALKRAEAELSDLNTRLNRGRLRQRQNIAGKVKTILRKFKCEKFLKVIIRYKVQVRTKRLRPGRPRNGAPVRRIRSRIYHLEVQRDKQALRAESRADGVFPLVTNMTPKQAPKQEVLLIYKYQPYVEKRHSLLKSELEIAPVYLKKPQRVVGLLHAFFLTMILDSLIERTIRQAMDRQGIESLPILPEGRLTKTPTTARLLEIFSGVAWYEFERGGETVTFPVELTPLQKNLLSLLDIDPSVYA
jgi:transposase